MTLTTFTVSALACKWVNLNLKLDESWHLSRTGSVVNWCGMSNTIATLFILAVSLIDCDFSVKTRYCIINSRLELGFVVVFHLHCWRSTYQFSSLKLFLSAAVVVDSGRVLPVQSSISSPPNRLRGLRRPLVPYRQPSMMSVFWSCAQCTLGCSELRLEQGLLSKFLFEVYM